MIDDNLIPEKSIFKASEVCEIVGVKPYILRFWESEFVEICSIVSSSGKKLYEKKDILLISMIKDLLFDKKLTLEKAKQEISKVDLSKILSEKDQHLEANESRCVDLQDSEKPQASPLTQDFINKLHSNLDNIFSHTEALKHRYQWI